MKLDTLYKRDKTGKKVLSCEIEIKPYSLLYFQIVRTTGFIDGKKQTHIDVVDKPKQNRTLEQQVELEAKSHFNSKKDEGYKTLVDLGATEDDIERCKSNIGYLFPFLISKLPEDRTDASGVLKPMKCTATNDTKTGKFLDRVLKKIEFPCDAQTKLDGVRCFATLTSDGWKFTSSSGKSYDVICQHIKAELDKYDIPDGIILDGELYKHGIPLEKISGWCRTTTRRIPEHDLMEFHIFDAPGKENWNDRREFLNEIANDIDDSGSIKFVNNTTVYHIEEAIDFHNEVVADGYEGAIFRNYKGKYAYGIRSSEIFKMKNFQDDEFEIIDYRLGKRGSFDMIFICKTKEGKTFDPKPLGDADKKEEYVRDFETKIKGQMGTVRYLNYSSYGVPVGNPVLKAIRNYE
jgi:ATP-dependent DNA ligase